MAVPAVPATLPDVGAVAVQPPAVLAKPAGGSRKLIAAAGILLILMLVLAVYFIGLPVISRSPGTGPDLQPSITPPTQTLTQLPTLMSAETTSVPATAYIPAAVQTYEEKYTETYIQVFSVDHAFVGGQKEVFTQDLTTPPLYIKFNITPKIFYGEKTVDIGLSSERVISTSYTSPNAWFKVSVYDAGNARLVEEQGFNKEHGIMTKQEFMVRTPGNYRVEMTGNDVIAEVRILTGKST